MSGDLLAVKLIGGWEGFDELLNSDKFYRRLTRNINRANKKIGRRFVRDARRKIRAKAYTQNSALTVILKGSSKPLVDKGNLFQSISFDQPNPWVVRVGVIKSQAGGKMVNLAAILHEGATIDVGKHPRVRKAVWAKVRKETSQEQIATYERRRRSAIVRAAMAAGLISRRRRRRKPSSRPMTDRQKRWWWAQQPKMHGPSKQIWRIPARPFLIEPLNAPQFVDYVRDTWAEAVRVSLSPPQRKPNK